MNHSHRLGISLAAVCPDSHSTATAGKKCDELEMEDEEGYTTLNLRPSALVITPGYSRSNKRSAFKAPASSVTVDRASISSSVWRPVAFAFLTLCLVLLMGLVALLALFFQVSKDPEEGKKLQEMREALCFEGKEKNASWQNSGADNCIYVSKQKKTWKQSQEFCSSRNSTLLVLKDKAKMVSLPQDSQFYWVGLSYISESNGWYWEDGTVFSKEVTSWVVIYDNSFCASLYGRIIYASHSCLTKQFWICERVAVPIN
ncbi:natural killer cells antigen CD94-like isoform X2 [Falco naumanni]|uniref:natural killer cells antigen CD94-like isoform X2 n=1 Tax=Falco naumanni TaxID=148594 RepID=UPI001ADE75BD|nr:natural killer cells antigen CD94-like isoform X2 [Falco naumanni]